MKKYSEYDANMRINFTDVKINKNDVLFHDIRKAPFDVYGFYDYQQKGTFHRLPYDIAEKTNHGTSLCQIESAGGRVRFATDSQYVAIKTEFEMVGSNSRTSQLAIAGFDMYIDYESESRYYRPFIPPYDVTSGFETFADFPDRRMRYITINFPYHTAVKNLYIGLQKDAALSEGMKYRNKKPVIFYGSSIVHGTCASRPGLIYENILSRRLNMDYLNLGFGGSANGDEILARYMANLDMCMFVSDYDYNANRENLKNTHKRLYNIIREKNPGIPYIIISKPDFVYRSLDSAFRREIIFNTYMEALKNGDENVYYIDGASFFRARDWDDCFIDTLHPNDIGFSRMADAIEPVISGALSKSYRF